MNEKINIQELIQLLSDRQGVSTQDAETFIKEFFLLIESGLERDKYVKVKGLGTFKLIDVDNRESVDVNTGERIEIQGYTKVSFTPENALKELVNRPFSHFEAVVLNDHVTFDDAPEEETEEAGNRKDTEATGQLEGMPEVKEAAEQASQKVMNGADRPAAKDMPAETAVKEWIEEPTEVHELHQPALADEKPQTASDCPSGSNRLMVGIMSAVMLGCACVVLALYWNTLFPANDLLPQGQPDSSENWQTVRKDSTEQLAAIEDTLIEAKEQDGQHPHSLSITETPQQKEASQDSEEMRRKETLPEPKVQKLATESKPPVVQQTKLVKKEKSSPAKTLKADSVNYVIVGTQASYTMKAGETLTKVALRFYGTKALWPYIVKHNKGVIKNPNNVPYGTVIQIPKLEKKL